MHKLVSLPSVLALAIGLSACASKPNENLEEARSAYSQLQSNPRSIELAALETQDAGQRMERANQAYLNDADEEKVDQLAYLAKRATELAQQTIALRAAEQKLMNMGEQRNEVRLQSREAELQRQQAELERRQQEIEQLRQSLNAKPTERGTLVTLGDLLFNFDSAELTPDGMRDIQTLANFLKQHDDRQVLIEGYTDSVGSDEYNQRLSERRAQSVERALIRMGVNPSILTTRGYGEQFPVATNQTPAGRANNRRVEVTISDTSQQVPPRTQQQESMGGTGGMGYQSGGMSDRDMQRMRELQQRMQQMSPEERRQHQQMLQQQMSPEQQRMMQERMNDPRMQQQMQQQMQPQGTQQR